MSKLPELKFMKFLHALHFKLHFGLHLELRPEVELKMELHFGRRARRRVASSEEIPGTSYARGFRHAV